jgi:glutamate-ammonia-ligase adenylyltransferase
MEAELREAVARAWRPAAAASSLERWLQVCGQSGWGDVPADRVMLTQVFGASWYFTRFLFYAGSGAAACIDRPQPVTDEPPALLERLRGAVDGHDGEEALDRLRLAKNEFMLSALVRWLRGELEQAALEAALTRLAESVLAVSMDLFGLTRRGVGADLAVLGLGRLAGAEMTFGSDLDLIFLFGGQEGVEVSRRARRFLRHVAAASPLGALYEVDMRLRPHGTAGALITSVQSFLDYHGDRREVWERQMMTRCRAIHDPAGIGAEALDRIRPRLYAGHDAAALRAAIRDMRARVERELGRPRGRFELKRGPGGIMDVDFACHYLQLAHGHRIAALQSCSTRSVLHGAVAAGCVTASLAADLSSGYEFLRRVETCLRLFDLRNVSSFVLEPRECEPLARAMNFADDTEGFIRALQDAAARIRTRFETLLADG